MCWFWFCKWIKPPRRLLLLRLVVLSSCLWSGENSSFLFSFHGRWLFWLRLVSPWEGSCDSRDLTPALCCPPKQPKLYFPSVWDSGQGPLWLAFPSTAAQWVSTCFTANMVMHKEAWKHVTCGWWHVLCLLKRETLSQLLMVTQLRSLGCHLEECKSQLTWT